MSTVKGSSKIQLSNSLESNQSRLELRVGRYVRGSNRDGKGNDIALLCLSIRKTVYKHLTNGEFRKCHQVHRKLQLKK